MASLRQTLGAMLIDLPRAWPKLNADDWPLICNRNDIVETCHSPNGVRFEHPGTSELHISKILPWVGKKLSTVAFQKWPVRLADDVEFSETPEVSFVIPHRGTDRAPLLEMTIRSIAAQTERSIECLVVEQCERSELTNLPDNTRLIHTPHPIENESWHKCFAFNEGVRQARGDIIICHDGDILVPENYVSEIRRHFNLGCEVVYPQRFLFYLQQKQTERIVQSQGMPPDGKLSLDMIKQNWRGGTLAIQKTAYEKVGGFDESFTNWSGEDTEFYDRCETLNGWMFGYIPFIHLWHAPQAGRVDSEKLRAQHQFTQSKLSKPREDRIRKLLEKQSEVPV